jgi:hypothetical protein
MWIAHLRGLWLLPEIWMKMGVVLKEKRYWRHFFLNRAINHRAKRTMGKTQKKSHARTNEKVSGLTAYLMAVHFEFPHNFNGNLIMLARGILGTVNVAKGTIAHLLQ